MKNIFILFIVPCRSNITLSPSDQWTRPDTSNHLQLETIRVIYCCYRRYNFAKSAVSTANPFFQQNGREDPLNRCSDCSQKPQPSFAILHCHCLRMHTSTLHSAFGPSLFFIPHPSIHLFQNFG